MFGFGPEDEGRDEHPDEGSETGEQRFIDHTSPLGESTATALVVMTAVLFWGHFFTCLTDLRIASSVLSGIGVANIPSHAYYVSGGRQPTPFLFWGPLGGVSASAALFSLRTTMRSGHQRSRFWQPTLWLLLLSFPQGSTAQDKR